MTTEENLDKRRSPPPKPSSDVLSRVKRQLWETTAHGFGNVLGNLPGTWYTGETAVFYTREKENWKKYIPPFQYGMAASLVLFVNFRITGSPRFQHWRQSLWKRIAPSKRSINTEKEPNKLQQKQAPMGYLERKRKADLENALKSVRVLTDFFISLSVGTSGTLFLLETTCGKDLRTDYEQAPLVAGRSLIADEVCPIMLDLYQSDHEVRNVLDHNQKESFQAWKGDSSNDPSLRSFSIFLKNCQKRKDNETKLRTERRISDTEPVLIPYTGVQ